MGSITQVKRADKATGKVTVVYRAYVRRAGYDSKSKVCASRQEAKTWLRDNEAAATLTKGRSARTLAQLVEAFVHAPPIRGTRYWSPGHLDFWVAELGAMKADEVSRGDINAAAAKLQDKPAMHNTPSGVRPSGRRLTSATVNRYLASLSSVFNYALDREILDQHPMKGGKVKKLKEGTGRRRILSPAEEAALMDAARASSWQMLALFLRMCLTTAARKGELVTLRWQDIRFEDSVALLGKTKNGRPRALPLVDDVRAALEAARKVQPLHSDYVFFDPRHPERPKNIDSVWQTCRKQAGLLNDRDDPLDRVVLHSTRHTAVTKMLKGGANLAQAAAVSGHQTLAMLKRYEHLASADAVAIAQRLLAGRSD